MVNVRTRERLKSDYEALRNARLLENKVRLESLSVLNKVSQLRKASSVQTKKIRPYHKTVYGLTPLRRSQRINPVAPTNTAAADDQLPPRRSRSSNTSFCNPVITKQEKVATNEVEQEEKSLANTTLKVEEKTPTKSNYEALRDARLLENKARLESLGVLNKVSQLREASAQTKKTRPYHKRVCGLTPVRRSQRINPVTTAYSTADQLQLQLSQQLKTSSSNPVITIQEKQEKKRSANTTLEVDKKRPANAPLIELDAIDLLITAESSARRCNSKGRGSVYNGTLGICCHFCRQKKLCGEEDCKRCGNCDVDEPCLGKTDCSVCHSSNGVFCRACLKVRYGEEIEEVRENKGWMCPHCIEEKGINPYWICNSSICLRKRNMSPTGLAIYKAREMGHKSVAHLLMEELKLGLRHKR